MSSSQPDLINIGNSWFDAFQDNGGPVLYSSINRTAAIEDIRNILIYISFTTFFVAFLIIFPGIRKERISTFICVTTSLFIGAVILISNCGSNWHVAKGSIAGPYRAFSREKIHANVGVYIGLDSVNITLKALPIHRQHEDINYNERFYWIGANQMKHEFQRALAKGLPFPILTISEYLSQDGEGFNWGRHYRLAGYYTSITLWLAFTTWLLMNILLCAVPRYGAYTMQLTGALMLLSNLLYVMMIPTKPLRIPFEGSTLIFSYGWCFWLVFAAGLTAVFIGATVSIVDILFPNKFSTILEVDYDTPYRYFVGNDMHIIGSLPPPMNAYYYHHHHHQHQHQSSLSSNSQKSSNHLYQKKIMTSNNNSGSSNSSNSSSNNNNNNHHDHFNKNNNIRKSTSNLLQHYSASKTTSLTTNSSSYCAGSTAQLTPHHHHHHQHQSIINTKSDASTSTRNYDDDDDNDLIMMMPSSTMPVKTDNEIKIESNTSNSNILNSSELNKQQQQQTFLTKVEIESSNNNNIIISNYTNDSIQLNSNDNINDNNNNNNNIAKINDKNNNNNLLKVNDNNNNKLSMNKIMNKQKNKMTSSSTSKSPKELILLSSTPSPLMKKLSSSPSTTSSTSFECSISTDIDYAEYYDDDDDDNDDDNHSDVSTTMIDGKRAISLSNFGKFTEQLEKREAELNNSHIKIGPTFGHPLASAGFRAIKTGFISRQRKPELTSTPAAKIKSDKIKTTTSSSMKSDNLKNIDDNQQTSATTQSSSTTTNQSDSAAAAAAAARVSQSAAMW